MRAMVIALLTLFAAQPALAEKNPAPMAGAWIVDLTSPPGSTPYLKGLTITAALDGTVTGEFYDSTMEAARWTEQDGRLCTAFRTTDGKGPYHSAACLIDGKMIGQTWAEQRKFLFLWTATRKAP